jgi:hypothetical protein
MVVHYLFAMNFTFYRQVLNTAGCSNLYYKLRVATEVRRDLWEYEWCGGSLLFITGYEL